MTDHRHNLSPFLVRMLEAPTSEDAAGTQKRKGLLERFRDAVQPILVLADRLDATALFRARKAVREFRSSVREAVSDFVTHIRQRTILPWGPTLVPRLDDVIRPPAVTTAADYIQEIEKLLGESFDIGRRLVDEPLSSMLDAATLEELAKLEDLAAQRALVRTPAELARTLGQAQADAVMHEVRLSLAKGESAEQLIDRLAVNLDSGPWRTARVRAEVIARTEIQRAQALAQIERARQISFELPGINLQLVYVTVQIGPWPCPICRPFDGSIYTPEGIVISGVDPMPIIPQHPRCRCWWMPIIHSQLAKIEQFARPEGFATGRQGTPITQQIDASVSTTKAPK